ncbi:RNA polymerase sigma factor [Jatrophihabitans lederbergiae]|uniref:Sigma-70 family RNA polymerase sigma factor n=1 Tax=Jatrophihabitans lederbergiae TaxID=3075547 RepID=A0ABU2JHM8_9ACTN|nr:sigma-70 family RNA polymerase sigma factor [Jatrophihabitans sp. DSM 44399]MDT0264238.1 sigma-70 family RNA polymerase sigma factor [Jatrophihabitans sp. DSM 44399]
MADQAPPGEQTELLAALDQLPGKQREVLVLRYWSELSEAEIAAVLQVPAGTVKSRASRGLRTMERLLRSRS